LLGYKAGRYAHARQFKRMRKVIKRQRTIVGTNWGQIPIVLMFREPSGSLFVSGVCSVQWAANCAVSGAIQAGSYLLCHAGFDPYVIPDLIRYPYILKSWTPGRAPLALT
jgi:hypothetical protein